MRTVLILMLTMVLDACGVETAGTAAAVGQMKAQEAKDAKNTKQRVENNLDAALQQAEQRRKESEKSTY